MPLPCRTQLVSMSVALAVGCCVVDPASSEAASPGHRGERPGLCAEGSDAERYLVVFPEGLDRRSAEERITEACGTTVAHYHQIGVAVVTAHDPTFDDRLVGGRAVSAQRSRTALDRGGETRLTSTGATLPAPAASSPPAGDLEWNLRQVGADEARRVGTGPEEVVVGVLDSGVDPAHPALTGSVDVFRSAGCLTGRPDRARDAWTPSTSPHGTHVAGIIAATGADGGPAGVAPGVRIASVKVVDDDGYIYPEYAVCGLMWAATNGMDITNNSYLVDPWPLLCAGDPGHRVAGEAVRRAVRFAEDHGVLTVAAVGNDAVDLSAPFRGVEARGGGGARCSALPAEVRGVLTVGSVGPAGVKARASSYGYGVVDVVAPGGDRWQSGVPGGGCVSSTVPGGRDELCGTSMAAPHASGVAALLASHRPDLTPPQLRGLVRGQANPIGCPEAYDLDGDGVPDGVCTGSPYYNSFHGAGLVNALAAVGG